MRRDGIFIVTLCRGPSEALCLGFCVESSVRLPILDINYGHKTVHGTRPLTVACRKSQFLSPGKQHWVSIRGQN